MFELNFSQCLNFSPNKGFLFILGTLSKVLSFTLKSSWTTVLAVSVSDRDLKDLLLQLDLSAFMTKLVVVSVVHPRFT